MYLSDDDLEPDVLRQGDVVDEILRFGALNIGGINRILGSNDEPIAWTVPKPPDYGFAMVLSHSCEIDPANDIKLTSVILAPIRDVHGATAPEKIEELIRSNLVESEDQNASFLKYFYLEPHEQLPYEDGALVDFSKIFSVRKNYYDELVTRKKIQLRNEIANQMALKFALYFYRTEE